MNNDSPRKAILVVLLTALICSTLVSAAVVILRPIQLNNQLLDHRRNIMSLTGLLPADEVPDDEEMLALYKSLDTRMVNIDEGRFDDSLDINTFNMRRAVNDPELGTPVPPGEDRASIGRRSRYAPVYMVWNDSELDRLILPVRGAGMWSMLYGYIALEPDFNTVAGMAFYEQNETPGLGDQITHDHWLEQWHGKKIYSDEGEAHFSVSDSVVQPGSINAPYQVDALTGATVTGNAVTGLVRYWFGPHGYRGLLDNLKQNPPAPVEDES